MSEPTECGRAADVPVASQGWPSPVIGVVSPLNQAALTSKGRLKQVRRSRSTPGTCAAAGWCCCSCRANGVVGVHPAAGDHDHRRSRFHVRPPCAQVGRRNAQQMDARTRVAAAGIAVWMSPLNGPRPRRRSGRGATGTRSSSTRVAVHAVRQRSLCFPLAKATISECRSRARREWPLLALLVWSGRVQQSGLRRAGSTPGHADALSGWCWSGATSKAASSRTPSGRESKNTWGHPSSMACSTAASPTAGSCATGRSWL